MTQQHGFDAVTSKSPGELRTVYAKGPWNTGISFSALEFMSLLDTSHMDYILGFGPLPTGLQNM